MNDAHPFVGSLALVNGRVANKHQLRTRHRAVFPDVCLPRNVAPTLQRRTEAAWLWAGAGGVLAGPAAAALHGAKWVADDVTVDLILPRSRAPKGIAVHRDSLLSGEVTMIDGMAVTTVERTAFDLGRWLDCDDAVARLDALGRSRRFDGAQVVGLGSRHPGSPNVRRLHAALDLHDPGAQSPKETWLRLLIVRGGHPRPRTQIPVDCGDGYPRYYLDMGWEALKVAVEYDGAHHRTAEQIRYDIVRMETLAALGWIVIRVVAGMRPAEVLWRVRRALASRVPTDRRPA